MTVNNKQEEHPSKPQFDEQFALTNLLDIDINGIVNPVMTERTCDPITRPQSAVSIQSKLPQGLPATGQPVDQLFTQLSELFQQHCRRNTHPGFFAYIASGGLPTDPVSYALGAALNQNVVGFPASPSGATIERTVTGWLCELAGLPTTAEGVFLGGGSMANLTAIGAALVHRFGADYRNQGIAVAADGKKPVIICSRATHFSIQRAAVMLGIGNNQVIAIDTDANHRMPVDKLAKVLDEQECPVAVVASAGTTTTGAVDHLDQIADLCAKHHVWMHVDAAYGGGALLHEELATRLHGIHRADSITMDLHKWFFQGLDSSVLLYRDPTYARDLFFESSDYLAAPPAGVPEHHAFFHLSPELSRRFRALPAYIAFCHYGREAIGRNVLHNVECAMYLAELVALHPELSMVAPPQLSITIFRYDIADADTAIVDRINAEVRDEIENEGHFLMSATQLDGRPVLRVCIVNHGTRSHHIDGLVAAVIEKGNSWSQRLL